MKRKERHDKIYSKCLDQECTFKPDIGINKYASSLNKSESVIDRLSNPNYSVKEQAVIRKVTNENFDPTTGQPFFRPRTGRPNQNRKRNKSVGHQLYHQAKMRQKGIEEKKSRQDEQQRNARNTRKTNNMTEKLIDHKKDKKFVELFRMLDSDGDGLISAQKIDISVMQPEILEAFTPLFVEMEELAQTLDTEEFVDASKRLFDTLTIPERDMIMATNEKWEKLKIQNTEHYSFQPNLNKNSMRLASKTRPKNEDVSEILYQKEREKEEKLRFQREQKKEEELNGCTFQPLIIYGAAKRNPLTSEIGNWAQDVAQEMSTEY